ncbi:MAG: hypothetical protein V4510_00900 [bacterium]
MATRKASTTKHAKTAPAPHTAKEILAAVKGKKLKVDAHVDAPTKPRGKKEPLRAKEILKNAKAGKVETNQDALEPQLRRAADILKELRKEHFEFHHAGAAKNAFDPNAFNEFFMAEIEAEIAKVATIYNDRFARWRCQCCDVIIPVPRRTTVYHGDYVLEHDDTLGLIVNGERWVPKAETPLEVVQPGRLRNPWTGRTIEGKDAGTTGAY